MTSFLAAGLREAWQPETQILESGSGKPCPFYKLRRTDHRALGAKVTKGFASPVNRTMYL
jgi:hypothetical protein